MTPYLVQRVTRLPQARDRNGVDRHFSMDYMGSALTRMRDHLADLQIMKIEPAKLGYREAKRLWFLGDQKYLLQATDFVKDQLGPMKHFMKERSRMKESLTPSEEDLRIRVTKFDAWWALDTGDTLRLPSLHEDDRPWLIFVQKADAQQWLKDLSAAPVKP